MIRVLQMIGTLGLGGSQTMLMNLYRNIDRERIQFDFVLDHPDGDYFIPEVTRLGGQVFTMAPFRGINAGEVRRDWNNFFYTHPGEYSVLHSHVRSYASLYLPVAKAHGLKTIIHSHNTANGSGVNAAVKDVLQKPLRHQADILMACSTEAGEWLYGKKACQSEKYVFLPNAVDTARFAAGTARRRETRQALGVDDRYVIGHVGRFNEQKNHGFLLEAFRRAHEQNPKAVLLLVGTGPLQNDVVRKAVSCGIAEDVLMTGNRDDIPDLLAAMDVFAFPSLWEGLPVTLIEAQAAGLPCVISDVITEDVDITPLITRLPPGDPGLWASELLQRRQRMDTREAVIRAGFDVQASARFLSDLYLKLDHEARRGRS